MPAHKLSAVAVLVFIVANSCSCRSLASNSTTTASSVISNDVQGDSYTGLNQCGMCTPMTGKCDGGTVVCVDTGNGKISGLPCFKLTPAADSATTDSSGRTIVELKAADATDVDTNGLAVTPACKSHLTNSTNKPKTTTDASGRTIVELKAADATDVDTNGLAVTRAWKCHLTNSINKPKTTTDASGRTIVELKAADATDVDTNGLAVTPAWKSHLTNSTNKPKTTASTTASLSQQEAGSRADPVERKAEQFTRRCPIHMPNKMCCRFATFKKTEATNKPITTNQADNKAQGVVPAAPANAAMAPLAGMNGAAASAAPTPMIAASAAIAGAALLML